MSSPRKVRIIIVLCAAALVAVQAALAEAPKAQFTAADQAAARTVVLKASDLGAAWTGTVKKGTVNGPTPCAGWNPRQSDLVITGIAESQFSSSGVLAIGGAQLYKTNRMAALDWQRTVVNVPLRCLTKEFTAGSGGELKIVSTKRMPFPRLATYTARFRLVADYNGDSTARIFIDAVIVGRGRTLAMIGLVGPYAQRADASAAEARLARIVLSRVKA